MKYELIYRDEEGFFSTTGHVIASDEEEAEQIFIKYQKKLNHGFCNIMVEDIYPYYGEPLFITADMVEELDDYEEEEEEDE